MTPSLDDSHTTIDGYEVIVTCDTNCAWCLTAAFEAIDKARMTRSTTARHTVRQALSNTHTLGHTAVVRRPEETSP
jgi:bacterioferritin-associated ferredoxin